MASNMARGSRRRRVLNEEVRSASGMNLATFDARGADAPRYSEQASVEHHPQVTDFVPRRKRAVLLTLFAGVSIAAAAEATVYFAEPIAAAIPGLSAVDLVGQLMAGVTAWTSAVALLTVALLAKLLYSLRRHRVDDYQGRYRVWRWVAWAAVLASINSVVNAHRLAASAAVGLSGFSLTAAGSEWWLAPLALVGGWIFIRMLLEVGESRSSLALMLAASACYAVAAAGALGFSPAAFDPWGAAVTAAATLVGHTILLAGMLIFARYVVLDVQGLIEHSPRPAAPKSQRKLAEPAAPKLAAFAVPSAASAPSSGRMASETKAPQAPTQASTPGQRWSDDAEDEDESPTRKLTKAERKRLRKQNRAA